MIRFHEILTGIVYSHEEAILIGNIANSSHIGWDGDLSELERTARARRDDLKRRIKEHLFLQQGNYCAYCCLHLSFTLGEKGIENAHIDHVLPKGAQKYKQFVFESLNLVLACPRCNGFSYKSTKDFGLNNSNAYLAINVSIIHPYRDRFLDHLELYEGGPVLIVRNASMKGRNSLVEFGLNEEYMLTIRAKNLLKNSNPVVNENLISDILSRNYSSNS